MKTEKLKELGITDQEVINAIMAENGRDIEKAKGDLENYKTQVEQLNSELSERDKQLKELKNSNKDNEALQSKIAELEEANKTSKTEYETRLAKLQHDNALELKLRDAKAKNVKAVRALIVDGEDEDTQIKHLKESEETAFLFELDKTPDNPPSGTTPSGGNPNTSNPKPQVTLASAISNRLNMKG